LKNYKKLIFNHLALTSKALYDRICSNSIIGSW